VLLVDTSVWVYHFRRTLPPLRELLESGEVLIHPFVIGEISCGHLSNRDEILQLLQQLPSVEVAAHTEVLALVEGRRLYGEGIGWVDAHLLASSILTAVPLWTRDSRLARVSRRLGTFFAHERA